MQRDVYKDIASAAVCARMMYATSEMPIIVTGIVRRSGLRLYQLDAKKQRITMHSGARQPKRKATMR